MKHDMMSHKNINKKASKFIILSLFIDEILRVRCIHPSNILFASDTFYFQ